jgi:hypothetical protein
MSTYEENKVPIDKLCESTQKWISSSEVHEYLRKLSLRFDENWQKDLRDNHWASSKFRTILTIHERIQLTDKLKLVEERSKIDQIEIVPLRTYLLLTCFDQLGLQKGWLTFDDFLETTKTKKEINEMLEKLKNETELNKVKTIYEFYKKDFSVKNSFMNFINEILNEETKNELINSIRITINNPKNLLETKESTTQEKLDYLYKIRNDYTHKSFSTGIFINPLEKDANWTYRETYYLKKRQYSVYTRIEFVNLIRESILKGIVNIIKENKYSV